MKVSTYYRTASCEQKAKFESVGGTVKGHEYYMPQALQLLAENLYIGSNTEDIVSAVSSFLADSFDVQEVEIASWAKEEQLLKDEIAVRRFVNWIRKQEEDVLEVNKHIGMKLPVSDGELTDTVHLITRSANGCMNAYILLGKCADKSPNGKGIHTVVATDLHCMLAKATLEQIYPGIRIRLVYLFTENDTKALTMSEHMNILNTKKSNLFTEDYASYYVQDVFDYEMFYEMMHTVLNTPLKLDCAVCECAAMCSDVKAVKTVMRAEKKAEKQVYTLPDYSEEQKCVIAHKEGVLRVYAGPGSGKTATVVGRMYKLVSQDGIDPELILAITFSKEAAETLKKRCDKVILNGEPVISTIHALAYQIIKSHEKLMGRVYNVMEESDRDDLISVCLAAEDGPIENLTYGKLRGGRGTIKRAGEIALAYTLAKPEEKESVLAEHNLGSDFERLADRFQDMKEAKGFICFDEMIPEALKLFEEYPEVKEQYAKRFWYVMVDEFQDISEEQFQFITILCGNGNLMAVADDDQAIYKFRKGDSKFIRELDRYYPDCKTYVLRDNYRSRPEIVNVSKQLIEANKERTRKEVQSTREKGGKVSVLPSAGKEQIEQAVKGALDAGFGYGDIAIIASKNRTLEAVEATCEFPSVLQKNYLRNDLLFKTVYYTMRCISGALKDDEALTHLFVYHNMEAGIKGSGSLYERALHFYNIGKVQQDKKAGRLFQFLRDSMTLYSCNPEPGVFVESVAIYLDMDDSASFQVICDMIKEQNIRNLAALQKRMHHMVEYEDSTMVPVDHSNAVLLITAHESKGLEFPVVLLADDFAKEPTEESRRVFYVAMTRAKENLQIMKSSGCFASEVERVLAHA